MKKYGLIAICRHGLVEMFKATHILMVIDLILGILHGLSFGLETMMQQRFFDQATQMMNGSATLGMAFGALAMLGLANVICQILNGISNYMPNIANGKISEELSRKLNEKIGRLAPETFENTAYLDDINKAEKGKDSVLNVVNTMMSIMTFYVPYFGFMGWYLFTMKPILILALVLIFIPKALTQILRTQVFAKAEDESAPIRREYEYYENCIADREYFKETRLLGGFVFFKKLYTQALDAMQKLRYKASIKANMAEFLMSLVTVAGYVGIIWLLFDSLMKGDISVGAFAAVFNSLGLMYGIMDEVICRHIGGVAETIGATQNYMRFMDMPERTGSVSQMPEWGDIELSHVSFAYPDASECAVKDVSFTLKKGETLAVVGENGSGKSTLNRVVSGLYAPTAGQVLHNGVETTKIAASALFAGTSAVFQKYQRYQMSLAENISISKTEKPWDETVLENVSQKAGLDVEGRTFINGYDTMLSREFDGVDLSGGQWQRVAIARGFFRDHNLIILDEPTAAIDPYEETRIYNRFAQIAKEKSALIVTNRLGSVKLADRILVMKDGQVVQLGTHEELMAEEGEYRRLYEAQEQWYE